MVATLAAGGGALAGCSSGSKKPKIDTRKIKLPSYLPYTAVKPDLPGTAQGVMQAFFAYPASPGRAVKAVPGQGGPVTALVPALGPQLLNPGTNGHWKEINQRLGVTLRVSGANGTEYTTKVQTTIAGGDLPDMMQLAGLPQLPQLLKAKFADLSEYLAGDAIKDYPMLAAIPTAAWRTTAVNGGIYGVPETQAPVPGNVIVRTDMFEAAGVEPKFDNAKEFLSVCQALSSSRHHTWAWGQDPASNLVPVVQQMLGVPNGWKLDGGKLTSALEAPETKKAIDFVAGMWKKELIHPDSIANPVEYPTWFDGKVIAMTTGALASWKVRLAAIVAAGLPPLTCNAILLPKFDGGGVASYWMGAVSRGMTSLKKADPKRIREMLRILDWMAAPFGTEEYLLKTYGVPNRNYTMKGSDPTPILNHEELMYFVGYLTNPAEVLYTPGAADLVKRQHELQEQIIPAALPNPVDGLLSDTQLTTGAQLSKKIQDAMTDIITGRKPLSTWDGVVKDWKSGGGDAIAREYEAALATR
ncbi:MAG TPA: extracellular solute-binding protein [Mycobacteriales bacterium]|nr:extracellular solute-binding protein [Mycobacteriales bacterium]